MLTEYFMGDSGVILLGQIWSLPSGQQDYDSPLMENKPVLDAIWEMIFQFAFIGSPIDIGANSAEMNGHPVSLQNGGAQLRHHSGIPQDLYLRHLENPVIKSVKLAKALLFEGGIVADETPVSPADKSTEHNVHQVTYTGSVITGARHVAKFLPNDETEPYGEGTWITPVINDVFAEDGSSILDFRNIPSNHFGGLPIRGSIERLHQAEIPDGYCWYTNNWGAITISDVRVEMCGDHFRVTYTRTREKNNWYEYLVFRRTDEVVILVEMVGKLVAYPYLEAGKTIFTCWDQSVNDFRSRMKLSYSSTCVKEERYNKDPINHPEVPTEWHLHKHVNYPHTAFSTGLMGRTGFYAVGGAQLDEYDLKGFQAHRNRDVVTGRFCIEEFQYDSLSQGYPNLWKNQLRDSLLLAFANGYTERKALDSNNIENLLQMKEIMKVLDVVKLAIMVYKYAKWGQPLNAAVAFFKLLGNSYLLYRFGILPTIKDARSFVKNHKKVINQVRDFYFGRSAKWTTLRGGYFANLPANRKYFNNDFQLETRCKVAIRLGPNGLFAFIGLLDSLGVLPVSHRIWDLIPGSFLVDYVLNIGDRLATIDTVGEAYLLYDFDQFVCSYRVTFPIKQEWLPSGTVALSEKIETVIYDRFVMDKLPKPGSTTIYDLTPPNGVDYKIVAGLILSNAEVFAEQVLE